MIIVLRWCMVQENTKMLLIIQCLLVTLKGITVSYYKSVCVCVCVCVCV